jgi:hypothetical protein
MNCPLDQADVWYAAPTAPTLPEASDNADLLAVQPETTEAMLSQLEYLLRTHGDEEARSDQSSLGDILAGLRNLADDLGLDFRAALAGSEALSVGPATLADFDPSI